MPDNISKSQNYSFSKADEAKDTIDNLVSIIEDLDSQITEWKDAADCGDPDSLKSRLATLEAKLYELETGN